MYLLGVDVGTSKIKAALTDFGGKQLDMESMPVKTLHPFEGASEIDMDALWGSFCRIVKILVERNPQVAGKVEGIGVTGQGDGLWAIDGQGKPVGNAILWNDTRSKFLQLDNREEIDDICVRHNANVVYAGSWHILLRWMKEHKRKEYDSIAALLHCKDWINYKLTGAIGTDHSDASTALLDTYEKTYATEILDAMGLEGKGELFPKPVPSTTVIGRTTKAAGMETGLEEGIAVVAGSIDVAAVALGLGVAETGNACTIIGTTLCNEIVLEKGNLDFRNNMVVCHIPEERYMSVMPTLNGTSAIDWIKDMLFPGDGFDVLEKRLSDVPVGSGGVVFHPYLYGERAPFRNPFATGSFLGLTVTSTKDDLGRAAYEGLAMSLCECYRSFPDIYDSIRVSGGGANSRLLCQIIADSMGKPVIRPNEEELGIKGIIRTLQLGLGLEEASNRGYLEGRDEGASVFIPDEGNHREYEAILERFLDLRNQMASTWKRDWKGQHRNER
ncbi:FGGY-family carbohydrate kinase [Anaerotalea alkaliphila]|uniref:Carbohydrate kinase n=1 Tax=Anaerotalea alkaliphila TaxID=2662126 RepID=A0A7X5HW39_9FIRM|nr:FGGY-family carbohydrate kinase [Anaerotalea alkaliphila]NDL67678.1 carbohydrate kinase [Anaerotalea alkaliphila]